MATKGQIRSLIKQRKSGGIADRVSGIKYGNRLVCEYINAARRQLLIDSLHDCPITDNFLKTFFPYVLWDDAQKMAYFNLPVSTVMLVDESGDNQGLQWVSGVEDNTEGWIIRRNMESQYMDNLEGGAHNKQVAYIEGSKVMLPRILKSDLSYGLCVKVRVIPDCDGYTDDEELPLPIKEFMFIDMCCKMMDELKMTPAKTGNDGNISAN